MALYALIPVIKLQKSGLSGRTATRDHTWPDVVGESLCGGTGRSDGPLRGYFFGSVFDPTVRQACQGALWTNYGKTKQLTQYKVFLILLTHHKF